MLIAFTIPILLICTYTNAYITLETENNQNLLTCASEIIKKYYERTITYVDFNYDSNEIIKIMNSLPVSIISRDGRNNLPMPNLGYVVAARMSTDFTINFSGLMKEPCWNPYALFLIIVKNLDPIELTSIFDVLLKYQVNDVIVVEGNNDANVYTYNPFDNYNCGKKYDTVIELGKCLAPRESNFYPNKLVTGLRNCSFKATSSHWPPYAIDPKITGNSLLGAEQYVMHVVSELEQFEIKYTKSIGGEEFSTIADNMSALGNLNMLQEKKTDFIFGGMMLLHFRANAFGYLAGHLPFKDDLRILVKKADNVPLWKNIFLEFNTSVWIILFLTFVGYFISVVVILRVKDKTSVLLIMVDLFFLHGSKMISKSRGVFITWVIFAYLISTYYQSSLVSMIANPYKNYQISTDQDLLEYKLEPCVSTVIQNYMTATNNASIELSYKDHCNGMVESIKSVSKSHSKFTISLLSIYLYNSHLFYDENGEDPIFIYKHPMNRVIYAIYLNKGFPLRNKLEMYTIRLRENGLVDKYLERLYEIPLKKFVPSSSNHKFEILFHWYILVVGSLVATVLFLLEIFLKKKPRMIICH